MNERSFLDNWERYAKSVAASNRLMRERVRGETWSHIQKHQLGVYQERQTAVVSLYYDEGMSVTDISRQLRISRPAVDRHLRNFRRQQMVAADG